eukprot:gene21552-1216_t
MCLDQENQGYWSPGWMNGNEGIWKNLDGPDDIDWMVYEGASNQIGTGPSTIGDTATYDHPQVLFE